MSREQSVKTMSVSHALPVGSDDNVTHSQKYPCSSTLRVETAGQANCGAGQYAGSAASRRKKPNLSRPAHELRALAATMSLRTGTPYREMMGAVGWSSSSTFARFYLRHVGLESRDLDAAARAALPGAL
jgi:hypothetical protein